ncbi:Ammonium transporter Rh type B [Blattella germanica]|nr:Ammonium transporter Rh type B [Blattella germanica]
MDKKHYGLGVILLVIQGVIIIMMATTAGYDKGVKPDTGGGSSHAQHGHSREDKHNGHDKEDFFEKKHPVFQDVHVMVFIGFGFLMTFLKRYGFSAIGFNFLIAALNVQWSILINGFFHHGEGENKVNINIESLLSADLATAALLISYGAVLGKTTPIQLVIMGLIETAVFAANEHLGLEIFKVTDSGGSIFVHAFGAYFGLAVSLALGHGKIISQGSSLEKEGSSYVSDTFAMIGTVFLWLFWPSFNAALIDGDDQHRAVINTYLSLTACCVTAFALSSVVSHENKFDMVHIQNATLAGGVAIGTACDMMVQPFGALLVGVLAGTLSIAGYHYLQPFLLKSLKLHDTCGVHNLHGMPGVLAGLIGALMASLATEDEYGKGLYNQFPARAPLANSSLFQQSGYGHIEPGDERTAGTQAAYQLAAVGVTIVVAIVTGFITGVIIRFPILNTLTRDQYYDDSLYWEMPADVAQPHHEQNKTDGDEKTVEAFVYDNSRADSAT